MAYSSSGSLSSDLTLPQPYIRSIESDLLKQVKSLKRKICDTPIVEAASICENVKDRILNQEDESQLTKVQNNHRKIQIASELLIGICYFHREKVDFEFMKIVCDVLHVKKYKNISKQLIYNHHLELKWEKDIEEEAKAKIMRFSEEKKDFKRGNKEQESTMNKGQEIREEEHQISENNTVIIERITDNVETCFRQQPSETFIQDLERSESLTEMRTGSIDQMTEISFQMQAFDRTSGNLTDLRACTSADITQLQIHSLNISEGNIQENEQIVEISIRETNTEEQTKQDINHIYQILDDGIWNKEIPEINQPESLLNIDNEIPDAPQSRMLGEITEKDADGFEADDDWSLPCLEPTRTNKKKNLIIDKQTKIVDYARRARHLNRNINVERVQVYQGPPGIIQSLSAEYLMTTPGFKSSIHRDQRSFGINNLYTRHLHSEKRPHAPFSTFKPRSVDRADVEQLQGEPTLPRVANNDVEEEYRSKMKMASFSQGRDILTERESIRPDDQDLLVGETLNNASANGFPSSRIIQAVQEPDIDKISLPNSFQHYTVEQFQGQKVQSKRSLPWFSSMRNTPPSSKLREFKLVEERLEEFWKMCEIQDTDKSVTVHQLLTFAEEEGITNLLTLLRILDKLSLQRKFILTQNDEDIVITPFERPYASQNQCLLLGTKPKY